MEGSSRNSTVCSFCAHVCKNEDKLKKHIGQLHSGLPSCSQCLRTFKNKRNLDTHMNAFHVGVHSLTSVYKTEPKVKKKTSQVNSQLQMKTLPQLVEVHSCFQCKKKFTAAKTLAFHNIRVHKDNWAVLDLIENGVSEEVATKIYDKCTRGNHAQTVAENVVKVEKVESDRVVRCEDCNIDIEENMVKDHISLVHKFDGMGKCDICKTGIMNRFHRQQHVLMEHKANAVENMKVEEYDVKKQQETTIKCDECWFVFDNTAEIIKHNEGVHKGQEMVQCPFCHPFKMMHSKNLEFHVGQNHADLMIPQTEPVEDYEWIPPPVEVNQEHTAQWSNEFYSPYAHQETQAEQVAQQVPISKTENDVVCRCDDCNTQFESVGSFNEHVYRVHQQDKMDRCSVCNTGWMSIGSLIEHNYDLHANGGVDNVGNDDAAEELEITRIMQEIDSLFEKENSVQDEEIFEGTEEDFDIENFIFNEKDEQSIENIENTFNDTFVENVSEKDMQSRMNIENSISDASMDNISVKSLTNIENSFSDISVENASEIGNPFNDTFADKFSGKYVQSLINVEYSANDSSIDNATEQDTDSLLNVKDSFIDTSVEDGSYNSITDDSIMDDMDDSGLTDPSDSDLKKEILQAIDEYRENHPESVDCETSEEKEVNALEELDKAEEKLKTALKSLDGNLTPKTHYCCPMSGCKFKTSKAGLMSKDTAVHFRDEHGIKARDMTPGMFRFIKVVG